MKSTSPLKAYCRQNLRADELSIHPNDGFDLGLMTTAYDVDIAGAGPGHIKLLNECPRDGIELSPRLFEMFGSPKAAILKYDEGTLIIEPK